ASSLGAATSPGTAPTLDSEEPGAHRCAPGSSITPSGGDGSRTAAARHFATPATSFARPDLRFAAWLRGMTPLGAALSRLREAVLSASPAPSASPVETAALALRV